MLVLALACHAYDTNKKRKPIQHIPLWAICVWIPVAIGVWLQLWGMVITAAPRQLTGALTSSRIPARFLNAVILSFAPLAFVIIMVPTAISDYHWHRVVAKDWPAFQYRYQDQTELSREMLVNAQKIWNHLLRSSLMLSCTCIAWFSFGVVLASLYFGIVWRTIFSLRETQEAIQRRLTNVGSINTRRVNHLPVRSLFMKPAAKISQRDQYTGNRLASSQFSPDSTDSDPTHLCVVSSTARREIVPIPIWRPDDPVASRTRMGHQYARNMPTYFVVQCGCILLGGFSTLIGVVATLYPAMEAQSRAPIMPIGFAVIYHITLAIGAANLASVAYSSFGTPFSTLLQADMSAAQTTLPRNPIGDVTNSSDSTSGRVYSPKTATVRLNRVEIVCQTEKDHHELPRQVRENLLMQAVETLVKRPSSILRPRPPEDIVLCSPGQNPTSPGSGAAGLHPILVLPALSFTYYDDER
ncbi:unnamed protein product [Tilletia controversa]|nr:unnamed protein product [Tilletia caries]CAD6916374.1 unnamed protein product [Tilletia controversa]